MSCELDEFWELKGFKILHLNARSLTKHREEIHLNFLDGRTDVVTLTETWLHSNVSNFLVSNPAYKIIRHDRQFQGDKGRVKPGGATVSMLGQVFILNVMKTLISQTRT